MTALVRNIRFDIGAGNARSHGTYGRQQTTLASIILKFDSPEGSLFIDGEDITKFRRCNKENVGYVPQDGFLLDQRSG